MLSKKFLVFQKNASLSQKNFQSREFMFIGLSPGFRCSESHLLKTPHGQVWHLKLYLVNPALDKTCIFDQRFERKRFYFHNQKWPSLSNSYKYNSSIKLLRILEWYDLLHFDLKGNLVLEKLDLVPEANIKLPIYSLGFDSYSRRSYYQET